jgi:hypothetical protein
MALPTQRMHHTRTHRDAFSLVRPCLEESDLANMDNLKPGQLRPEFRAGFDR